jgi:hypothetical protein
MRVINTNPDKYLIECIELDLYDLLYIPQVQGWDLKKEVESLLQKYQASGVIQRFHVVFAMAWDIVVHIYTPRKIKIRCCNP